MNRRPPIHGPRFRVQDATGGGPPLSPPPPYTIAPLWKNLTDLIRSLLSRMPTKEKSKESYYERNRRQRLAYQKAYYWKNKEKIIEKRKNKEKNDPKEIQKKKDYAASYYRKNRERIFKKRAETKRRRLSNQKWAVRSSFAHGKASSGHNIIFTKTDIIHHPLLKPCAKVWLPCLYKQGNQYRIKTF